MRIGFIGAGNMGGAIIRGYAASRAMYTDKPDALFVYDSDTEKMAALADAVPVLKQTDSLAQLTGFCDMLVLCVKPNVIDAVLDELAALLPAQYDHKLILSIAAGISIAHIREKLGDSVRVARVMPNTPVMVGEGMSAMSASANLLEPDAAAAEKLFGAVGLTVWIPEEMMDTVTGISGSSPAYAYLYIEGLIRAGMEGGLSKEIATTLAAQSTLGAAKMALENLGQVSPQQLCNNVCSPGGTTIEAVRVLDATGFTGTVQRAAQASAAKSKQMTQ